MITSAIKYLIRFAYVAIDVCSVFLSVFLAAWLRQATFPLTLKELFLSERHPFQAVFLVWLATVVFFNGINHLYQTRREIVQSEEVLRVFRSVMGAVLTVLVFVYAMKIIDFPRSVFLLMVTFTAIFFCVWRIFKRWFVNFLAANGYNNFNVLIIGAGKVGLMLAEEIKRHPGYGLKIVGFLDDARKSEDLGGDYRVLGTLSELEDVARRHFITKLFLTIHPPGTVFHQFLEIAKKLKMAVRVVPEAFDRAVGDIAKYSIGFIPILEYSNLDGARTQTGKRIFDFFISGVALLFLAPFFLLVGILIKRDNPGPIFYCCHRYGKGGRVFKMWKFRSMVKDAHQKLEELKAQNEVDGPIFKIRLDPRVTRFGRFLRKFSIDELPQIFNVFIGDMSLVGPRPLPIAQVEREDLRQLKRLEVRPGITGLWQVRGRSDLPFHRLIKWDTWYINNWSFFLDLNILLETIPVVLKGKGAY